MMRAWRQEAGSALDALVRQVPGVASLYRSGPLLAGAVAAARDALVAEGETQPMVSVGERDGRTSVAVTIGVRSDSAAVTCRAVHDAILAWSREQQLDEPPVIAVTVAHVGE